MNMRILAFMCLIGLAGVARAQDSQSDALKVHDQMKDDLNAIGSTEEDALKNSGSTTLPDGQQIHDTVGGLVQKGGAALDDLPSLR